MIDREKVIKGIEHCFVSWTCSGCPYRGKDECIKLLMKDALELLKAQEPRVLTLNEANAAMQKDDVIWIEKKGDPVCGGLKKTGLL